jgi:hypothetical protein
MTIQLIADALASKKIQVLTYNRQLKEDTTKRLNPFPNASVNTFHGFVSQNYQHSAHNDTALQSFLFQRRSSNQSHFIPPMDILVIDEAQDLDPLLYELVLRICSDTGSSPQLVVLGDQRQVAYYMGRSKHVLMK